MKKYWLLFTLFSTTVFAKNSENLTACIQAETQNGSIHIAKIDLNCKNLEFVTNSYAEKGITVLDFAKKYQTAVAINANFFYKDYSVLGLAIANGKVWHKSRDTRTKVIFACDNAGKCTLEPKGRVSKINPKWQTAISGWQYYNAKTNKFECSNNDKFGCVQDIYTGKHPRTMLGLDDRTNTLYLVMVEGRILGNMGYSLDELANLAQKLGLTRAINLDGGGSSAMVIGDKRVSSLPMFQSERAVGNVFGVRVR